MKLAFIGSPYDPSNPFQDQSVAWYIKHYFEKNGVEVLPFVPEKSVLNKLFKFKKAIKKITGRSYFTERENLVIRSIAKQTSDFLNSIEHDHVFSFGSVPHVLVDHKREFSFWTDATIHSLVDYYDSYKNLSKSQYEWMYQKEQEVFDKASNLFFASDWASRSAIDEYKIPGSKVHSVPLGANLPVIPNTSEVLKSIEDLKWDKLRFIWIGVEWKRKGGDKLVELSRELNKRKIEHEFNIVGVIKEVPKDVSESFTFHGFLRKSVPSELNILKELFYLSHFHILLTEAEAFGHVFAEANAHGVPNIATFTGGVPSAVKDNVSGKLIDKNVTIEVLANEILDLYSNQNEYIKLSESSLNYFQSDLNWNVGINKILEIIN